MGAFFDSIHIRSENSAAVRATLEQAAKIARCNFQVGPPVGGWISVFPSETGVEPAAAVIARLLPDAILHLAVHDDDFFTYQFYRGGQLIDRYNSCPDYFEKVTAAEKQECRGRPELLADLLPDPNSLAELKKLLARKRITFESERLTEFAELFGLANACASYDLLQGGDLDDEEIEGRDQFVHIETERAPGGDSSETALQKIVRGDIEGAIAAHRRALELNPAHAGSQECLAEQTSIAHFCVFQSSLKEKGGDEPAALALLNHAVELQPDSTDIYKIRGLFKKNHCDLAGALADLDAALRFETEADGIAVICNNRGETKKALGDQAGAMADFDRAIASNPKLSVAYNNRGNLRHNQGDQSGAMTDLNRSIKLDPESSAAWNNRGSVKRALGDFDGAIADHTRAIQLTMDSAMAYNNRGLAKKAKKDLAGALADYDKAIQLKPDLVSAYINRGLLKKEQRDLGGALADLNRAIELNPREVVAFTARGDVNRLAGNLEQALRDCDQALQLMPDNAAAYNNRGLVKRAQNDLAGAVVDFDRAAELSPRAARIYSNRALVKRALGDISGADADEGKAAALELPPAV